MTYDATDIYDTAQSWTVNAWAGYEVEVLTARGSPMRAHINSNTATTLVLNTEFSQTTAWPVLPNAGTAYAIKLPRPGLMGRSSTGQFVIHTNPSSANTAAYAIKDVTIGSDGVTVTSASQTASVISVVATGHNVLSRTWSSSMMSLPIDQIRLALQPTSMPMTSRSTAMDLVLPIADRSPGPPTTSL